MSSIAVTGSAGKTGRAVVAALAARRLPVRALVRRDEQRELLRAVGAAEARVVDLEASSDLTRALAGCRALYHVCPNLHPRETEIGERVVRAAREAGVGRLVLHSVLHPQIERMPHHWRKLRVEQCLVASGLDFTVLQPTAYLQNLDVHRASVLGEGVLPLPYGASTRIALVDLGDVAAVAARVLSEPGHERATYELCGTPPLAQTEVAAVLGEVLGRPVRAVAVPRADWARDALASGLDPGAVDDLLAMFRCYEEEGFGGGRRVLGMLLGRPPTGLRAWAERWLTGDPGRG